MYPQRELSRLAVHKRFLRRDIALHRTRCAQAAARLAQPVAWLDRALAFWRRLPPLAQFVAMPVGLLVRRTGSPRLKLLGALLRWGPLAVGALRGLGSVAVRRRTDLR